MESQVHHKFWGQVVIKKTWVPKSLQYSRKYINMEAVIVTVEKNMIHTAFETYTYTQNDLSI